MRVCICTDQNEAAIKEVIEANAEAIRNAKSLKAAAKIVFVATNSVYKSDRCGQCIDDIRQNIVDMGLREAEAEPESQPMIGSCDNDCNTCATQTCRTLTL